MKRCPKCSLNYSDNTLDFCLEDGARLVFLNNYEIETPTVTSPPRAPQVTEKTAEFPFLNPVNNPNDMELRGASEPQKTPPADLLKETVVRQSNKVLEIAPLVIALAHNWWQWLYLNNQYYSSFSTYILSANFLMWLLLLAAGVVVGLVSIKRSPNKSFAVAGLVILSVNLLLFLVPKR